MIGKVLEWVYLGDNVSEHFVENVVDTGAAMALCSDVLNKISVQLVTVSFDVLTDKVENKGSLIFLVCDYIFRVEGEQFSLLLLDCL